MSYPIELREHLVRRMIGPEACSAHQLSRDTGVPRQTLCRWRQEALSVKWMKRKKSASGAASEGGPRTRPGDRPAQEKLRVVLESASLSDEELGAFLRREGVHEAQLAEWRESAFSAALESLSGKRQRTPSPSVRERNLGRQLRSTEKDLKEAKALLVLQGKLAALSEGEGNDTTKS